MTSSCGTFYHTVHAHSAFAHTVYVQTTPQQLKSTMNEYFFNFIEGAIGQKRSSTANYSCWLVQQVPDIPHRLRRPVNCTALLIT